MSHDAGILFSWIGTTDLNCAGIRERRKSDDGDGPIAQAVAARPFSRVELLCNDGYKREEMDSYVEWLRKRTRAAVTAVYVKLDNPTHHAGIHKSVVARVDAVLAEYEGKTRPKLSFHLSPGTPAMHAVWLLLAKSKVEAQLIQTSTKLGLEDVAVPFDIDAVFVGDYYRPHDERLRELAAGVTPTTAAFDAIKHKSEVLADVIRRASRLAPRSVPILILGESGTGKELFAKAIHAASLRASKAFRAVNCGAIPEALVESELFGHVKGAFTGADKEKKGIFESTHGGTVFLDEVGDLPMAAQVKLLRVLQEGEVQPVGEGGQPRKVDVRILAATHKDLPTDVVEHRFREDLFYRLAVGVLRLPALRDRGPADLNFMIDVVLEDVNAKAKSEIGGQEKKLSPGARRVLRAHAWPGNVRELVNTLTRAAILAPSQEIREQDAREALLVLPRRTEQDLLGRPLGDGNAVKVNEMIDDLKRHYVRRALEVAGGQKTKAAKMLGLENYQTLSNWMSSLGIAEPGGR